MRYNLVLKRALLTVSLSLSALISSQIAANAETTKREQASATETPQKLELTSEAAPLPKGSPSEVPASAPSETSPTSANSQNPPTDAQPTTPLIQLKPTQFQLPEPDLVSQASPASTVVPAVIETKPTDTVAPAGTTSTDVVVPVPGTAERSSSGLQAQTETAPAAGRTIYKFSYAGFGVNFGAGGNTGLGTISFAALSKFAITPNISFRPSVLVGRHASFNFPFTYDFPISGPRQFAPYVGAGVKFSTGEKDNVDLLLTAGVDYPLNPELALTASVSIGPVNNFDIGFALGLAYTFSTQTITTTPASIGNLIPSQPPRPNPSYLGVGINFGAGGDSGLGKISGAVYSKIALGSTFSFRPAVFISSDFSFLFPVTYDFNVVRLSEYIRLAPYLGAGGIFSTGDNDNATLLLSGGVDIPISDRFAATVGVNVAPFDGFSIGFLLGGAYTFGSFAK